MEFPAWRRWALVLLVICTLLLVLPTADARRSLTRRRTRPPLQNPPGFTHYFLIVVIALAAILVFICVCLNSLRCIHNLLSRRNEKRSARLRRNHRLRRTTGYTPRRHGSYEDDDADRQVEFMLPPPSYAEIIGEGSTAPPPPYSSIHVGDAGWGSPQYTDDYAAAPVDEQPTVRDENHENL